MSCDWPFLTSCKVDILKEIKTLQPVILCSSTKSNHQGCAAASGAPGNFSPFSNKRISFAHLKLTKLSQVDLSLLRARLHGEFQPGLKFRSAHRAEILLWLHAPFHGRAQNASLLSAKTQSMRMLRLAFRFLPRMKRMVAITWIFQPVWPSWKS